MQLRLILITSEKDINNEHEIIKQLFEAGLGTLHIRKPGYSYGKMKAYIKKIPHKYRKRVVLHSRHLLAVQFKLKGIHFTEKNRKYNLLAPLKFWLLKMFNFDLQVSTSYHKLRSLEGLSEDRFDYVFLSPIFGSISKKNHKSTFRLAHVQDALRSTKAKVIALGGIEAENIFKCKDVGFQGVAVLGAVWNAPEPVTAFKEINRKCKTSDLELLA